MAKKKKAAAADFRYATGEARVPWAAVGEPVRPEDVKRVIEFLMPPAQGKKAAHNRQLKKALKELDALGALSESASKLSLGDNVSALEAEAAKFLGAKYACFCTNATSGFEMAYRYANIGPGDEVIIPAITFIATMAYPLGVGAKVVIADVDPATVNIDPADVARKITKRTKAIVPVHIGGYPADMDAIMKLARKHNIMVLEDAAHAFGGTYRGKKLGAIGHFGAFSYHEVKNVNSLGEGGLLVTNLPAGKRFAQMRFLNIDMSTTIRNWLYDVVALKGKYGPFAANNCSATEIQALVLRNQMNRLKTIIAARSRAARYLNSRFAKVAGIITPPGDSKDVRSTHHLYLLRVDHEEIGADVKILKKKLTDRGVTNIPHFAPLYKFSIMKQLGYDTKAIEASCPKTEMVFDHQFTHLPLYEFTEDQLKFMADAVIESVREMRAGR